MALLATSIQTASAQGSTTSQTVNPNGNITFYGEKARDSRVNPCKGRLVAVCAQFNYGDVQPSIPGLDPDNGLIAPATGLAAYSVKRPVVIWRVPLNTPADVFNAIKARELEDPYLKVVRGLESEVGSDIQGGLQLDEDSEN